MLRLRKPGQLCFIPLKLVRPHTADEVTPNPAIHPIELLLKEQLKVTLTGNPVGHFSIDKNQRPLNAEPHAGDYMSGATALTVGFGQRWRFKHAA